MARITNFQDVNGMELCEAIRALNVTYKKYYSGKLKGSPELMERMKAIRDRIRRLETTELRRHAAAIKADPSKVRKILDDLIARSK